MSKPPDSAVIRWAIEEGRLDEREPGWHTVAELAAASGIDNHKMDLRCQQAVSNGILERKQVRIKDSRGRTTNVYVYRKLEVPSGQASKDGAGTGTHRSGNHQRARNG